MVTANYLFGESTNVFPDTAVTLALSIAWFSTP
jgi:hypothetical protein